MRNISMNKGAGTAVILAVGITAVAAVGGVEAAFGTMIMYIVKCRGFNENENGYYIY